MTDESSSSQVNDKQKEVSEIAMRKGTALVRCTKMLPKRGGDFEFCNSFSTFNELIENQRDRVLKMMTEVMRVGGYPTRFPKEANSDLYMDLMVNACDNIAERAGVLMDVLEKAGRDEEVQVPKVIIGAESTKRAEASKIMNLDTYVNISDKLRAAHIDREKTKQRKPGIAAVNKPQKLFNISSSIDNSRLPFINKLRIKHNAREAGRTGIKVIDLEEDSRAWPTEEPENEHPYRVELEHFTVPEEQMVSKECIKQAKMEDTTLTIVNTKEGLEKLVETLNGVTEFAADLEHNSHRSYLGLTCLMQLSTRTTDYIVDPFPIWNEMYQLNEPFSNPKILKVLHGSGSDIEWLQRDFGIYVVNMFDTYNAMRHLNYDKFSLAHLVQKFCGVVLDKQYQTDDWRVRPLPATHMNYARSDTHYLLYCYDHLREALLANGNEMKNLLNAVYSESKLTCMKVYVKPHSVFEYDKILSSRNRFNSQQVFALTELFKWRDGIARSEDESLHYVLPNHMMLKIAESLPRDVASILACCSPVPVLVKQHVLEIQTIMYSAREKPVERTYIEEKMARGDDENILSKYVERNRMSATNSVLRCKLDFSQSRYDEETGLKESCVDLSNLNIKSHQETFLNFLGDSYKEGEDLIIDDSTYCPEKQKLVLQDMEKWASPYEAYCLGVKNAEKKKKALELIKKNNIELPGVKMYSHHDPVVSRPRVIQPDEDDVNISTTSETGGAIPKPGMNFTEDQLLTRSALKRQAKRNRDAADIKTNEVSPQKSSNAEQEDRDSSFGKRQKKTHEEEVGDEGDAGESLDFSNYDTSKFNQRPQLDPDFDPFNQQFRLGKRSNTFSRRGRGGKHRMDTMSTRFKPKTEQS